MYLFGEMGEQRWCSVEFYIFFNIFVNYWGLGRERKLGVQILHLHTLEEEMAVMK